MSTFDDEEIKAEANRLRQCGWMNTTKGLTEQEIHLQRQRPVRVPKKPGITFGPMAGNVKAAANWLADQDGIAPRPIRQFISDKFSMSFDDAGRVVAEAGRMLGREL